MAAVVVIIFLVLRNGAIASVDMQPEPGSDSFDGKEENLFDVDLIPMNGEENDQDDEYQSGNRQSNIPSSFDPADIQADLVPMYDYEQPRMQSEDQYGPDLNRLNKKPPDMDFDVVVKHRLTEDGRVIFEPQIRTGKGRREQRQGQHYPEQAYHIEPNKLTILPKATKSPMDVIESTTIQNHSQKKVIVRRVVRRKPGDPGYGSGRVVKIVKRIKN